MIRSRSCSSFVLALLLSLSLPLSVYADAGSPRAVMFEGGDDESFLDLGFTGFGLPVKGKGVALPMPSLATLTSPLTVQLRRSGGGPCWGSVFSFPPAKKHDGVTFKDTAD